MQKKLIVLAVAGLVSSGAFAAENNVTLYGIIDLGLVHDSGSIAGVPTSGSSSRLDSGVAAGDRIGIKGTEDLGGGLKTNFVAETGFCADTTVNGYCTGANNFMGRQAWLNLSGNFGTVQAGRQYVPEFLMILAPIDPFGMGSAGQAGNLFNPGVSAGNPRANNAVAYITPDMGGFTGVYAHSFGEVTNNSKSGAADTVAGSYANGPLYVAASYITANDAAGNSGDGLKTSDVGASYDFGVAKLRGMYQVTKNSPNGITTTDASNWMIGASVPMGGGVGSHLAVSYIDHNDKMTANQDATQVAVGYYYGLSKMTTLYTVYGHINNKNGATFTDGNAGSAGNGTGDSQFNLGVTHAF